MAFDDMEPNADNGLEEAPPPEESNNRPFVIVAGVLGGITLLALLFIVGVAFFLIPQRNAAQATQKAQLTAQAKLLNQMVEQTRQAMAFTATPTETPASTQGSAPTTTPVVAIPTKTALSTPDPRTATVAVLLTQAAIAQKTPLQPVGTAAVVAGTPTVLPTTGFADEVGIPGLLGLAVFLILVIFLTRRLRTAG